MVSIYYIVDTHQIKSPKVIYFKALTIILKKIILLQQIEHH